MQSIKHYWPGRLPSCCLPHNCQSIPQDQGHHHRPQKLQFIIIIVIQTLTSHSSTPTPRVTCDIGAPWAFNKMTFTATALNTTQTEWANANTKLSTAEGHCICSHRRVKVIYVCKLNYQTCTWPWVEYPSWWHATEASVLPQESSHTVPHRLSTHISTLPSFAMLLPASRSWPVVQGAVWKHGWNWWHKASLMRAYLHSPHQHQQNEDNYERELVYWNTAGVA